MTEVNVRDVVLDILLEILEKKEYSHLVLAQVLEKYQYLNKQQRSFITRTVQGTLERMMELDAVLDRFSSVPVRKMKPVIRNLLRESVYQILYMDGVRDAAVCDEAVKLAKKRGFYQLRGFVNGVLRSVCRNREQISFPDLSTRYSMPEWIVNMWTDSYGTEETERILAAFLSPAPTWIRVNTEQISVTGLKEELGREGISARGDADLPYALQMDGYDYLQGMQAFVGGFFYVQDISSMKAVAAAGIKPGMTVLDVCGAPGGKSLDAAMLLQGSGSVECRDISDYKVELIRQNRDRCCVKNMVPVKMDALCYDPDSAERADVVIADLPCSGLGIIGKKPDIKYHMTGQKALELAELQRKILDVVCLYVKPGGKLLYSTCTIHEAENQENVDWFLKAHPEFACEKMEQLLPAAGQQDGFFYAVLHKEGASDGN